LNEHFHWNLDLHDNHSLLGDTSNVQDGIGSNSYFSSASIDESNRASIAAASIDSSISTYTIQVTSSSGLVYHSGLKKWRSIKADSYLSSAGSYSTNVSSKMNIIDSMSTQKSYCSRIVTEAFSITGVKNNSIEGS
jgi:hypothetical protein